MVIPPLVITGYGLWVFIQGARRFWQETDSTLSGTLHSGMFWQATRMPLPFATSRVARPAAATIPDARFSEARRWFHHLTFYGFLLDLASTTVAAFYDHFLDWPAPYPLLSWPVVLGTAGGVMLMIGTGGLLYLKWRSDPDPAGTDMRGMDVAFLVLLFLASLSGLALLLLRETSLLGTLLVIHLGLVAGIVHHGAIRQIRPRRLSLCGSRPQRARAGERNRSEVALSVWYRHLAASGRSTPFWQTGLAVAERRCLPGLSGQDARGLICVPDGFACVWHARRCCDSTACRAHLPPQQFPTA